MEVQVVCAHIWKLYKALLNNLWINLKIGHNENCIFKTRVIINLLCIKIGGMPQKQVLETYFVGVCLMHVLEKKFWKQMAKALTSRSGKRTVNIKRVESRNFKEQEQKVIKYNRKKWYHQNQSLVFSQRQ